MKRLRLAAAACAAQFVCAPPAPASPAPPPPGQPVTVDQGASWSDSNRNQYYRVDQGSQLMPLAWFRALKQPDGTNFLADRLARYGYLRDYNASTSDLPVGFTTSADGKWVGMNCAACHTREIAVGKTSYRIDGGPAIADFETFLTDLDAAVRQLLAEPARFQSFAADVLGGHPTDGQIGQLHENVQAWFTPYDLIVQKGLPKTNRWGPARLDAVGMIFDRLTGLDIGPAPEYTIPDNIRIADAPVRYPFLWNASRQDLTQWPGFSKNGDALLALARNTGEVFGVFARFHPRRNAKGEIDYTLDNSSDTKGLLTLEDLITKMGQPKFPWPTDPVLAAKGKAVFGLPTVQGGCIECHGQKAGQPRLFTDTWLTRLQDVGTDNREWVMFGLPGNADWPGWQVYTGVLSGSAKLQPIDGAFPVLENAVLGTILQRGGKLLAGILASDHTRAGRTSGASAPGAHAQDAGLQELKTAFRRPTPPNDTPPFLYEARVLYGIWAAAPYLHNGSVPTLADLLNPVSERPKSFKVGPEYDPAKVGLAADQTAFDSTLTTTGCDWRSSGNSNCGHEFGVTLTPDQKRALLEYLKTL